MNNEASIILKVLDKASAPLRAIGRSFQTMGKDSREALQQSATVAAGLGAALAGAAAGVMVYAGKQSADMQSALGEVASLGVKDLENLKEAAREFSNEWAGTTGPAFVRASYDIKSGISSLSDQGVAEFTRLAALTAKATKGTVAEMTSLFASGYGIYKEQYKALSDMEFGALFSAGIAKAVQDFKTTGPKMQEAIQQLGASATKAQVPLQEQLTILGMLQQTMGGSEAGTKYKAFLKDVAKAGGELGLPFLDANKKLKSLPEILDILRKKYGDTIDEIEAHEIQQAFGSEEGVALIKLLYSQTEALRQNAQNMGAAMQGGTGLTEEMARAMNAGLGAEATKLGQRMNNLAEIVGGVLTPTLLPLLRGLGQGLVAMQGWVRENPGLVKGILLASLVFGGLVAALGLAAAAMTVLNMAVWANPITWVVAGIVAALAALVAAGVWLVANWDKVKSWWNAFWGEYGNAVLVTMGIITGPLGWLASVAGVIINNWEGFKAFFSNLWSDVVAGWNADTLWGAGEALIMGLWNGMASLVGKVGQWLGDKVRAMVDWLPDWAKEKLGLKVDLAAGQGGAPASNLPAMYRAQGQGEPAQPVGVAAGGFNTLTAAQALGQPQNSRFDGKMVVKFENAPPGTRIAQMEQSGDSGMGLEAGLTLGVAY
ncbi:MAG: phage tail tape measure protein [Desulfarculus sp.]|nr:phage tail tape measure protein [Desulfarculus sp.]